MKKAMGFLLAVLMLASFTSAQECRQPVSKTANPAVEIGMVGATAGIDLATKNRTWGGGWNQTGAIAGEVVRTRSNERINNRQADSQDYATCEYNRTARESSRNAAAVEIYRTAAETGTSGTVFVQNGQVSADVRSNEPRSNPGQTPSGFAQRRK